MKAAPAFKGVGMQYVNFAIREPKLFQLLFMAEQAHRPTGDNVLPAIDDNYPVILQSVGDSYSINRQAAEKSIATFGYILTALQYYAPQICVLLRKRR